MAAIPTAASYQINKERTEGTMAFFKSRSDDYTIGQSDDTMDVMMPARSQAADPAPAPQPEEQPPVVLVPQRTTLGAETKIKGDIASKEAMVIDGHVEGNIVCSKQVTVSGSVVGNINCESFALNGGTVKGNLECTGSARLAEGSLLEGNVKSQEFSLGGTLKGDANITGLASLFSVKACMEGDLTAGKISISEGATMFGKVEMTRPKEAPAPKREAPAKPAAPAAPAAPQPQKPQAAPAPGAEPKK